MEPYTRFRSTVGYYVRFRRRYPHSLIEKVARRCGLDGRGRLLDLGCGPGFIAIAMAPYFAEVVGVDPLPAMLRAAAREARAAGVKLKLKRGSSETLSKELGLFRMAAMGRAFHWMERDATLAALNELVEPGGTVALLSEHMTNAPENRWSAAWDAVANKWSREAFEWRRFRRGPDWEQHDVVLRRSPFSAVERLSVVQTHQIEIDEIIGRTYSKSITSPAVLGVNRRAFEKEMREALLAISPSGSFTEIIEYAALLAWRPSAK
jgi:SAM-dependent methyltransferase